jgi:toxin ParE1/3/4
VSKPRFTVRLLRAAEEDLDEIIRYIAADNPPAAESILSRIEKGITLLKSRPRIGRIPEDENLVRSGYRVLVGEDYLIFYTQEERTIFVHRIVHGARDYLRLL